MSKDLWMFQWLAFNQLFHQRNKRIFINNMCLFFRLGSSSIWCSTRFCPRSSFVFFPASSFSYLEKKKPVKPTRQQQQNGQVHVRSVMDWIAVSRSSVAIYLPCRQWDAHILLRAASTNFLASLTIWQPLEQKLIKEHSNLETGTHPKTFHTTTAPT